MCKNTFEVCGDPWATSGKLAASVANILSKDNQLWKMRSYKYNIIWIICEYYKCYEYHEHNMLNNLRNVSVLSLLQYICSSENPGNTVAVSMHLILKPTVVLLLTKAAFYYAVNNSNISNSLSTQLYWFKVSAYIVIDT